MSYTPTEWETGDIVTAEKLNKLENGVEAVSKEIDCVTDINANILVKQDDADYLLYASFSSPECFVCAYTGWWLRNDGRICPRFWFALPQNEVWRVSESKFKYRVIMYADGNNDAPFDPKDLDETNGTTVTDWYAITNGSVVQTQPINMSSSTQKKSYVRLQLGLFDLSNNLERSFYTATCVLVRDGSSYTCTPYFNDDRQDDACIYRFGYVKHNISNIMESSKSPTIFSDLFTEDYQGTDIGKFAKISTSAITTNDQLRIYALMGTDIHLYSPGVVVAAATGGGGALFVNLTENEDASVLDKTWKEIDDALADGTPVFIMEVETIDGATMRHIFPVSGTFSSPQMSHYIVAFVDESQVELVTNSENGYPSSGELEPEQ